jgi:hypothetical protein
MKQMPEFKLPDFRDCVGMLAGDYHKLIHDTIEKYFKDELIPYIISICVEPAAREETTTTNR